MPSSMGPTKRDNFFIASIMTLGGAFPSGLIILAGDEPGVLCRKSLHQVLHTCNRVSNINTGHIHQFDGFLQAI